MLLADTAAGVTALEYADAPAAPIGAPQRLPKPVVEPAALSMAWALRRWRQRLAGTTAMPFRSAWSADQPSLSKQHMPSGLHRPHSTLTQEVLTPDGTSRVFVQLYKVACSAGHATSDAAQPSRRMGSWALHEQGSCQQRHCCMLQACVMPAEPLLRSCKHANWLASQRCAVCLAYCQGILCFWEGPVIGQQCMRGHSRST